MKYSLRKWVFTFINKILKKIIAWKLSILEVILVCIFPHLDWVRRDTEYSVQMPENADHSNSKYGHFSSSETSNCVLTMWNTGVIFIWVLASKSGVNFTNTPFHPFYSMIFLITHAALVKFASIIAQLTVCRNIKSLILCGITLLIFLICSFFECVFFIKPWQFWVKKLLLLLLLQKKENIYLNLHKNFRKCLNQIENQTQKVPKH